MQLMYSGIRRTAPPVRSRKPAGGAPDAWPLQYSVASEAPPDSPRRAHAVGHDLCLLTIFKLAAEGHARLLRAPRLRPN